MDLPTFIFRVLAGFFGGASGTVVLLGIFLTTKSVLSPLGSEQPITEYVSPIFVFILLVMFFLSSTVANIVSTLLLGWADKSRYKNLKFTVYQVLIVSLLIFVLMAFVYFGTSLLNPTLLPYIIGLHVIISAQVSALILEIASNNKHALIGVYGVTFSLFLSFGILLVLSTLFSGNTAILLFALLPVVWGATALMGGLVTAVYEFLVKTYERDFLAIEEKI